MTLVILPDIEAMVIMWLAEHPELELVLRDSEDTNRVYANAREAPAYPFVTVTRIGGRPRPRTHWLDQGHLQILSWAEEDRDEAFDICAMALAAAHELVGTTEFGVVTAVEDVLGPRPLYDPETSKPRFIAEILVTASPNPQPSS